MRRVKPLRLSRRAVLRGAGVSLALPWLEIMGGKAQAAPNTALPRVLFFYFPTGYRGGDWIPNKTPGSYADFNLPGIAQALNPFKSNLSIITGLANDPAAVGNGGDGIHARGTGCFLTNEVLERGGFKSGVSADQLIAQSIGAEYSTMMLDGAFSHRNYGLTDIDGVDYVHGLSHGEIGGKTVDHLRWVKITREHFAYLLQQIIAGGGGGRLNVGRQIAVADDTPSANAVLTVMQAAGVNRTSHGNSSGGIAGLSV